LGVRKPFRRPAPYPTKKMNGDNIALILKERFKAIIEMQAHEYDTTSPRAR
jgi:hypothetical protein